jgi:hypothetical protein
VITSSTSTTIGACYGKGVSATITAGTGGTGCTETYQWRQDAGTWQTYTSGTTVGTTAVDSIEIKATRNCTAGCSNKVVRSRWVVKPQINKNSSFTLTNCADTSGYIAQLTATNPSPNTGLWTKTSGPGTIQSPTSYNASIIGITSGATAVVKWVVTNSIGCKDSSSQNITAPTLDTTLVSKYSTHFCLTCPVQNGDTYTYYDANGKILMKVTDINDGNTLGSTNVCADLDYNTSGNPSASDVQTINNENQEPYLPRSWSVNPDSTNASYRVSLYFTDEELNALMGKATGTQWSFADVSSLGITGYPNVNTTYTEPGGPNGIFYAPIFTRVGGYWVATITSIGAKTFFVHPLTYPNATLPVELISFAAHPADIFIHLNWVTASELNNDHFDVERSNDGRLFSKIGMVKGGGSVHEIRKYYFDDYTVDPNKMYYYRLKQVDYYNTYKNSDIVMASIKNPENFKVGDLVPNPASGYTSIQINSIEITLLKVDILGMDGRLILENTYQLNNGTNKIDLVLDQLDVGTYLCRFETENGVMMKKLIKTR